MHEKTKKEFRPPMKLVGKQTVQAKVEMERLIDVFTASGLAHLMGFSTPNSVHVMRNRGHVSAQAAHDICLLDIVKKEGFTREGLRPDVKVWRIDEPE